MKLTDLDGGKGSASTTVYEEVPFIAKDGGNFIARRESLVIGDVSWTGWWVDYATDTVFQRGNLPFPTLDEAKLSREVKIDDIA